MTDLSAQSFRDYSGTRRPRIEAALDAYSSLGPGCPARLREAMRYSLLAPGKRLRPLLTLMGSEACSGRLDDAMPAACAVEMIHAYSLIHDDLPAMDDDDLRRGRPTCHVEYDEATAILAGDALFALALEVLATHVHPAERAAACCQILARAAGPCHLVGGQADDMQELGADATREQLEAIHRRKTGAMIRASIVLGAMTAQATPAQVESLGRYAERLGLAFQITDDLLDHAGDEAATGKRVGKDAARGKATYPLLLGVDASRLRAEQLIHEAIGDVASFGERAAPLVGLAEYVLTRSR